MLTNGPWYLRAGGEVRGPFDLAGLRAALDALPGWTEIDVREGEAEWRRADDVPRLRDPFAGPIDPGWPNSPTKVALFLLLAYAGFQLAWRYHLQSVWALTAIVGVYLSLPRLRWPSALAMPLACVLGLAAAASLSEAARLYLADDAAALLLEVLIDGWVPLALAIWFIETRSRSVAAALVALEAVAVVIGVAALVSHPDADTIVLLAIHVTALVGFGGIVTSRIDNGRPIEGEGSDVS